MVTTEVAYMLLLDVDITHVTAVTMRLLYTRRLAARTTTP